MRINFVQKIIDFIRGKSDAPIYYFDFFAKKFYGIKGKNIKTLILGSSHLEVAFLAEDGEFNFATVGQDLYYSYNLYKYLNRCSIKNIVISYSYFSAWSHNIYSVNNRSIDALIKTFCGINYQIPKLARKYGLYQLERFYKRIFKKKYYIVEKSYNGNYCAYPEKFIEKDPVIVAQKINRAHTLKPHDQLIYLEKLLSDVQANNQKLYIVITPYLKEYRKYLIPKKELFKDLYEFLQNFKEEYQLIDLFESDLFNKDDFYDYEHLNLNGAKKITKLIRDEIQN